MHVCYEQKSHVTDNRMGLVIWLTFAIATCNYTQRSEATYSIFYICDKERCKKDESFRCDVAKASIIIRAWVKFCNMHAFCQCTTVACLPPKYASSAATWDTLSCIVALGPQANPRGAPASNIRRKYIVPCSIISAWIQNQHKKQRVPMLKVTF